MAEGLPEGLRLVTKLGSNGQVIACPRGRYPKVKKRRDEFSRSGVYLLVGQDGEQVPRVYVGETEQMRSRLDNHYANKDFWQEVIAFTTTDTQLNRAQVKYLEARLQELAGRAEEAKRAKVDNKNSSQRPREARRGG